MGEEIGCIIQLDCNTCDVQDACTEHAYLVCKQPVFDNVQLSNTRGQGQVLTIKVSRWNWFLPPILETGGAGPSGHMREMGPVLGPFLIFDNSLDFLFSTHCVN